MCIATTRKPHPNRHKWSRQHPNGNKVQLDYVILTRKWINSLQNRPCYNTVEIDSDHHILTVTVKFSFRATKNTSNISMYNNKSITSNDLVRNKIEQMCVEADAASNGNDTKELFNITKKLNGESSKILLSSVNKRNGESSS